MKIEEYFYLLRDVEEQCFKDQDDDCICHDLTLQALYDIYNQSRADQRKKDIDVCRKIGFHCKSDEERIIDALETQV